MITCADGHNAIRRGTITKDGVLLVCSVAKDTEDVLAAGGSGQLPHPEEAVHGAGVVILREIMMEVPAINIGTGYVG